MRDLRTSFLLAFLFLGACSSTSKPAGWPCETCRYRVDANTSHDPHPQLYCMVDGRVTDCRKVPPDCPECARRVASQEKVQPPPK